MQNKNLELLSKIARDMRKKPEVLSQLARKEIIRAIKYDNKWHAYREEVIKDYKNYIWDERKFRTKEFFDEVSIYGKKIIIFVVIYVFMFEIWDKIKDNIKEISLSPYLVSLFMTLGLYFLTFLHMTFKTIKYSFYIFRELSMIKERLNNINFRVEEFEKKKRNKYPKE